MTRVETVTIIELLRRAYPRFIELSQWEHDPKKVAAGIVDLWADMFAADPFQTVGSAARQHIATSKFAPTIAEIRAIITAMTVPLPSPADAWEELQRLLQSGIAPDNEREAYNRMTPVCKAATLAAGGWYVLSMTDDHQARRAFFAGADAHLNAERVRHVALPTQTIALGGAGRD